jgi:hypothetical protein
VSITNNALYALNTKAWTLYSRSLSNMLSSDYNYLFHPYVNSHIAYGPSWTRYTFANWKTFSGLEAHSKTNWFTQPAGEASRARILYNPTKSPLAIDLGDRKYLDLDQNSIVGSITLSPFTSRILVDNGLASLTLLSMTPTLRGVDEAADFSLAVSGAGFTSNSVVRWNGAARPTTFVSGSSLTATLSATDVSAVANVPVTVYDPSPVPTGTETQPLIFHVVQSVSRVYLPVVLK